MGSSKKFELCRGPAPPAGLSPSSSQPTYATLIKTDTNLTPTTPLKPKEFALIEKFSYGKPDMAELRKLFPQQLGIKGGCSFGLTYSRHMLVRLFLHGDFISVYSKTVTYIWGKDEGRDVDYQFRIQNGHFCLIQTRKPPLLLLGFLFLISPRISLAESIKKMRALQRDYQLPGRQKSYHNYQHTSMELINSRKDSTELQHTKASLKEPGMAQVRPKGEKNMFKRSSVARVRLGLIYYQLRRINIREEAACNLKEIVRFNIKSKDEVDAYGEVHTKFQVDLMDILNEKTGKKNIINKGMGCISFDPEVSSNADRALATVPESGGASKNRQEHDNVAIATTG
ncbi:hypothetical protein H5410_012668 [Solanum commersonii]|uniref:DUF4283 domain-containing protein n=1 Tax=Solanum commersonii TaxID=4109 RepID=A0A9J6ATB2_SOLCO|nr:hypothetical protein H5410_012668 [Solanum commersonii]